MFGIFKTENKTVLVTDDTWNDDIINFKGVSLVDVWAPWCGPCKILGPVIDEISNEIEGNVKICKLNQYCQSLYYNLLYCLFLKVWFCGYP